MALESNQARQQTEQVKAEFDRERAPLNQYCLLYGLEALRILADALPRAVGDDADIELSGKVLWGSMVAGLALHNCNTHIGPNIRHALGSLARVHHGLATGLASEVSLSWLVSRSERQDNHAQAAQALSGNAAAEALPDVFTKLISDCRIAKELPIVCAGVTYAATSECSETARPS